MANPRNGEIEFEIGGKTYTYLLGMYGLAKLEERIGGGKTWSELLQQDLSKWSIQLWLSCFHCGLLLHHEPISEKEASILLDELTLPEFVKGFGEAIKKQFGDPEAQARPQEAAVKTNGIGTAPSALG